MKRAILFCVVTLTSLIASRVAAHTVWIEPLKGELVIRFAEPGTDFETSPGYLDALAAPATFSIVTNKALAVVTPKKSDHFLVNNVTTTNVVCTESIFTVRAERKPHFYARWQPTGAGAGKPLLTFDLVPTEKAGEVRVYFRGKPLGGVKATLRGPDEKEQEMTADAEGLLRFEAKASGQYLLTVPHHREPIAGFHLGVAYKETSHNAALSWKQ